MPISVYNPVPPPTYGDVHGYNADPNGSAPLNTVALRFGFNKGSGKTIDASFGTFLRFDIDIPDNAIFNGAAIRLVGRQQSHTNGWNLSLGMLDPNHALAEWTDAGGFNLSNYFDQVDLPWVERNLSPITYDTTVLYEGTVADEFSFTSTDTNGADQTMYEGTGVGSGVYEISGLVDKFSDYFADAAATAYRDGNDNVPVAFILYRRTLGGESQHYDQICYSVLEENPLYKPQLTISWDPPPTPTSPTIGEPVKLFGNTAYDQAYICDRCARDCDRSNIKREYLNTVWTGFMVCPECFDMDHPQLRLRDVNIVDSSTLRDARMDASPGRDLVEGPTDLAATPGEGIISLSWTDTYTGTLGYKVERSDDGVVWATIGNTTMGVSSFTDANISSLAFYYYRVTGSLYGMDFAVSNVATATAWEYALTSETRWDFNTDGDQEGWASQRLSVNVTGGLMVLTQTHAFNAGIIFQQDNGGFFTAAEQPIMQIQYRATEGTEATSYFPSMGWYKTGESVVTPSGGRQVSYANPFPNQDFLWEMDMSSHPDWEDDIIYIVIWETVNGTVGDWVVDYISFNSGVYGWIAP